MAFKDWKNRAVRIRREIQTRGGKIIPAGTICWTGGSGWRGKVDLYAAEYKDGAWIEHVNEKECIELLVRGIRPNIDLDIVTGETPLPTVPRYEAVQYNIRFNKQEGQYLLGLVNGSTERLVECVNNMDFEEHFTIGVFYLVRDLEIQKGQSFDEAFNLAPQVGIEDKFGNIIKVPQKRFKYVETHAMRLAKRIATALR